ncbi:MAG TPA: META domain-containing protein [Bacteroidales bacterium]|mgnify:CR=1 FL=1|jgi:heat shock protein HslJ|nr:META domain-containing protein [Bacteroidales bacterium]HPB88628.1 META domain-containing protein [Bacteroidales bacterium]HPY21367.1 META domain-containing protein [Bacteroidales bacterium]HQA92547.1 META domain-containing protein [Bacteroidales bacterium]HQN23294.1 META domain-containing protein [Bacteroidales bacterium]
MKKLINYAVVLLAAISLAGCGTPKEASVDLNGKWQITELTGLEDTISLEGYFVQFESAEGLFSAYLGCNQIAGKYLFEDPSITFSEITRTEIACENMNPEELFCFVIEQVALSSVTEEGFLQLKSAEEEVLITLKKVEEEVEIVVEEQTEEPTETPAENQ